MQGNATPAKGFLSFMKSVEVHYAMTIRSETNLWEKREAELSLLAELLRREQNRLAGAKTYSAQEIRTDVKNLLCED